MLQYWLMLNRAVHRNMTATPEALKQTMLHFASLAITANENDTIAVWRVDMSNGRYVVIGEFAKAGIEE